MLICTLQHDDGLQLLDLFLTETILAQFLIDIVNAYLVQFVDSYGDIHDFLGSTNDFGNAGENLAVVNLNLYADAEAREYLVNNLHQFHLVHQRITTHHICIALIELTIAAFLRAVSTPYGLNLITFEGQLQFLSVHHHITGKRHCQVIAQAFLAHLRCQVQGITLQQFLIAALRQAVAAV